MRPARLWKMPECELYVLLMVRILWYGLRQPVQGCLKSDILASVDNELPQLLSKLKLHDNYPNPFNLPVKIAFELVQ